MFLKNLRVSRLMEADKGTGTGGGADTGNAETTETKTDTQDTTQKEEKAFTQADLDRLIQERIAREKKGMPTKEELKAYQEWRDSQKSEQEKQSEALTNAEKAKLAAEEKAAVLEAKVTCLSKGVNPTSVDDVVVLAKVMVTEEVTIDQAIDKVLEKYPSFKGETQKEEQKGFKVGAGDNDKNNGAQSDALAKIFGNKN